MENIICFDGSLEALIFYLDQLDWLVNSIYVPCKIYPEKKQEKSDKEKNYQDYQYVCIDWRYPGYFITIDYLTNKRGILHEFCWRCNYNQVSFNHFYKLLRLALANITIYSPKPDS